LDSLLEIHEYEHIESLWENKIRETLTLEFKSEVDSNNNEVGKDISSFANSEGGIIVYGVKEGEQGFAKKSSGIILDRLDEKIQQIVSSIISPPLEIKIQVIDLPQKKKNSKIQSFIVVKIPKSQLYIHQVTTTGKFYIRNNTVTMPFKYEALTMKQSEISLRYEKRFQNKTRITNSFKDKEEQFVNQTKAKTFFMIAAIPQVVSVQGEKITRRFFNKLICRREGGSSISSTEFYYNWFRDTDFYFDNKPKGDGRIAASHGKFLEINDDGTVYFFNEVEGEGFWEWWDYIFAVIDFLHMIRRFYSKRNYYGGVSLTCKFSYVFPLDNRGRAILSLDRHILQADIDNVQTNHSTINGVEITENIQIVPFTLEDHVLNIFEKIFETLGMDDPKDQLPGYVKNLKDRISVLEQTNYDEI